MHNKYVLKVKNDYQNVSDLITKEIKISSFKKIYLFYLESVSSSSLVNDFFLKNITLLNALKHKSLHKIINIIPAPNTKTISYEDINFYLTNGFTIVIYNKEIIAFETKADITRSIAEPTTEQSIFGPKDAFTENIQINIGLLKRRIKSPNLKNKSLFIGKHTNTLVEVLYMDNIAEIDNVNYITRKLSKINIDGIIDSGTINEYLNLNSKTPFPTIIKTERPDLVSSSLLEGKIAIFVDTSPFILITPAFFTDYINPITDNFDKYLNVNIIKIIRFICFFITMMLPGIYISLINYNPEAIPTTLLLNFAMQRDLVPFPSLIEALILLFAYEILRESNIRSPSPYGNAISILGALILGEASVEAGFVSPIMIIVIAITFISSLIFTEQELINAARYFRILFLVGASLYGLYGILLIFIFFGIHLSEIKTLEKPYLYPISPFNKAYLFKTLLKSKITNDTKRSKMLTKKNLTKQEVK